ncbi:MFS transporter [Massilia arenosa]|uniref:MFS transporter n=1 Tax=Zemynaea arenosa TaxID=2561931 RepID=A0A4Y9SN44_9BURK|nr:MFS transporter [Massilia arenosa]TFW28080.1 MFS transporter [Massilia arenosa]
MTTTNARAALLRNPNFRWLIGGGVLSMLGDQFTLIALPWLVLRLTDDPAALGVVLALMGVPRAVFILVGGALVDRYSPKSVALLSKVVSAGLLGLLAALTLSGHPQLWQVNLLALGIGLAQAFGIPSATSLMPQAVERTHLQASNGMMMSLRQLSMLAGPLLAALLIALAGGSASEGTSLRALGYAFAFDCATFLVSTWTLMQVRLLADAKREPEGQLLRSIGAGLAMVWRDVPLRSCLMYWGVVSFLIGGATQVALPVLARDHMQGASAFGVLMAAHGAGALAGMIASSVFGKRSMGRFGLLVLGVDAVAGMLLAPLGMVESLWQGVLLLALIGALGGFIQVAVFTWLQGRVPPQMMGRAMSIFMFILMGLAPLSAACTGYLLRYVSLPELFGASGVVLILLAAAAWLMTPIGQIGTESRNPA